MAIPKNGTFRTADRYKQHKYSIDRLHSRQNSIIYQFFSFFEAMQAIENAIIYKCVFDSCFNHLFRSCRFRESIFILFRKVKQCFSNDVFCGGSTKKVSKSIRV